MRGRCCWNCRSCGFGEYINASLMMCQNCSFNEMPNIFVNGCIPESSPPIFYEPTAEMYVLIGISCLGILSTIIITAYIYNFRKTPMVMASTPDLCYLQSATQIFLFIISGLMLPSPNMIVCGSVWAISTVLLVITHAIFLIKAIRLSRPKFYTKLISYASTPAKCSGIMLFIITISQTLISVIWILLRPPTPQRKLHEQMIHCRQAFFNGVIVVWITVEKVSNWDNFCLQINLKMRQKNLFFSFFSKMRNKMFLPDFQVQS